MEIIKNEIDSKLKGYIKPSGVESFDGWLVKEGVSQYITPNLYLQSYGSYTTSYACGWNCQKSADNQIYWTNNVGLYMKAISGLISIAAGGYVGFTYKIPKSYIGKTVNIKINYTLQADKGFMLKITKNGGRKNYALANLFQHSISYYDTTTVGSIDTGNINGTYNYTMSNITLPEDWTMTIGSVSVLIAYDSSKSSDAISTFGNGMTNNTITINSIYLEQV